MSTCNSQCVPLLFVCFASVAKCSLSSLKGLASHIILPTNSIRSSTICLAAHLSSARMFTLEMKSFNSIFETPCNVSARSTETLNLHRIWFLPLSNTTSTVSKRSRCTTTCIQVIGGGSHRCKTRYSFNFCTDKRSQDLLESQCPSATIIPLIVSTDKTLLTLCDRYVESARVVHTSVRVGIFPPACTPRIPVGKLMYIRYE
jgi:hypothetical protein